MRKTAIKTIILIVLPVLFYSCSNSSSSHYFKNGVAKYNLKDYKGAVKDYRKAIEIEPDYADAWYGKAICESLLNRYEEALNSFNKAVELDPSNKDAVFNRAYYVKQKTGDFQGAIEDYNFYINTFHQQDDAFAYSNMGYCKYKLNDLEGALSDIDKSLELNANNPMAYKNRALVYFAKGETDKACSDLNKALELGYTKKFGDEAERLSSENCKQNDY